MYFFMNECLKHTGDLLQLDKNQFTKIPLFIPDTTIDFEILVDEIIVEKKDNLNSINLENKLDQLFYKLYDLTEEEIDIIENSTQ